MVIIKSRQTFSWFYSWFSILSRQCSLLLSAPGAPCRPCCALIRMGAPMKRKARFGQRVRKRFQLSYSPRWSALPQGVVNLLSPKVLKHKVTFKVFLTRGLSLHESGMTEPPSVLGRVGDFGVSEACVPATS